MPHRFRVTVERLDVEGDTPPGSLQFEVTNHDDILAIAERLKGRDVVPEAEVAEFAIGLKLFGEVLLRNRKSDLFAGLMPHFGDFMKRLKSKA